MPIFSSQLGRVEEQSPEKGVKILANHIRKLQEELEYRLMNLDSSNINEIDASDTTVLVDGKEINNVLQDSSGNYSQLLQTVGQLNTKVYTQEQRIGVLGDTLETQYSTTEQTDQKIQAEVGLVTEAMGEEFKKYTLVTQTEKMIQAAVSGLGGETMLRLDEDGFIVAKNVDGEWEYVQIDGDQLIAGTVIAGQLAGGTLSLLSDETDRIGKHYVAGEMTITGADTSDFAVDLTSYGALRLTAASGAVYLDATDYDAHVLLDDNKAVLNGGPSHFTANDVGAYMYSTEYCFFGTGGGQRMVMDTENLRTYPDRQLALGEAASPWSAVFADTGEVETSDARKKHSIERDDLERYEQMHAKLQPLRYKLNNGTSDRYHFGFVAQDVEQIMDEVGLESTDFGGFVKEPVYEKVSEDGTYDKSSAIVDYAYALRYSEFVALNTLMIQKLTARVAALEGGTV